MKIHILPALPKGKDEGDGGVRRVVEAQYEGLPAFGWEITNDPAEADLIAAHIEIPSTYRRNYPRTPMVLHNHGLYWSEYEWEEWCYKTNSLIMESIRAADAVTAVSDWTARTLRRNTNRRVDVIEHGVDMRMWERPREAEGDYVLWNKTRPDPICDPQPMIELARMMPDVKFMTTFGMAAGAPNINTTGRLSYEDASWLVRNAGVYLCTTRETFGIGTLEALAAGVPVVGWRWGGQAEIIEHGVDGWLASPGDFDDLMRGVRWAFERGETLRAACRAKAALYPWRTAIAKYDALYRRVIAESRYESSPKVSVVIPAYNLADYLDEAISSVVEQTMKDWELIVVDDASPDECGAIADRWAASDARIRVIHNETNQYLAQARNIGFAAARGRYVFPLDADDAITPNTLELLSDALDAKRDIDIAYGNVFFTDENRVPISYQGGPSPGHSGWPMPMRQEQQLIGPGQLLPYASMMRWETWRDLSGYRGRARSSEDCLFWLGATSYGHRAEFVTRADTLIYRVREDSMSSAKGEGWEEHRGWFPWVNNRTILPSIAREGERVGVPTFEPALVSVIIPVGPNHGRLVIDAVDSVDAQTYRGWECIVVNDSGEPLPLLPSWVIQLCNDKHHGTDCEIVHPPKGVAAARNRAIEQATAKRFLPLDADDYLMNNALEVFMSAREQMWQLHDEPVLYCDFWEDPEGTWRRYETLDANSEALIKRGLGFGVTVLTPVEYWREVGGYDEDLPGWEDWAFQLKLAGKGYCTRRIAIPLFAYRKRTGARREDNMQQFEQNKAAMMGRDFGAGPGGVLLACGRCPSGRGTTIMGSQSGAGAAPGAAAVEAAAMVGDTGMYEYIGNRAGKFSIKGKGTGNIYFWSTNPAFRRQSVYAADAIQFEQHSEFRRVEPDTLPHVPVAPDDAPVMVASREAVGVAVADDEAWGEPPDEGGGVATLPRLDVKVDASMKRSELEALLMPDVDRKQFRTKQDIVDYLNG
jgi:glycosyltransferase involved in cell wall biosynthesis